MTTKKSTLKQLIEQLTDEVIQEKLVIASNDGTEKTLTSDQKKQVQVASDKGDVVSIKKKGMPIQEEPVGKILTSKQVSVLAKKAGTIVDDAESDLNSLCIAYKDKIPVSRVKDILDEYDIEMSDLKSIKSPEPKTFKNQEDMFDYYASKGLLESDELNQPQQDLAQTLEALVAQLSSTSESTEDTKLKRYTEGVLKHLTRAQEAYKNITNHESMLAEKKAAAEEKESEKHVDQVKKHLSKKFKDKKDVDLVMAKYHKVAKKLAPVTKDPVKSADQIYKHMLKEAKQNK